MAKPAGFDKYLKYSKDYRSHWLKCLTRLDSSMGLLSNRMQVVAPL